MVYVICTLGYISAHFKLKIIACDKYIVKYSKYAELWLWKNVYLYKY